MRGTRAEMAAALEYGTHRLLGQHLYRQEPQCKGHGCTNRRSLFEGLCHSCTAAQERTAGR